jgi:uncharacterized protein (DUF1697 family)
MALVVFLRGVNVGGHRTFRPSILAQQLKHYDAINVGAAGTFVIRKPAHQAELRSELQSRLPFETEVVICTGQDLITAASGDPFANTPIHADVVRFVSVLAKRPRVLPSLPLSLPVPATTRNWNTFTAIVNVLKSGRENSRNTPRG